MDDAIVGLAPRRTQRPTKGRVGGRAAGATEERREGDRGRVQDQSARVTHVIDGLSRNPV